MISVKQLRRIAASVMVATFAVYGNALAEGPYELHESQEWVWAASGAAVWLGGMWGIKSLDPLTRDEIESLDRNNINGFDRKHMRPYREDHAGDAASFGTYLFPLGFWAWDKSRDDMDTIAVMWAEVTLWNQAIAAVAKATRHRTRPYVYDPDAPAKLTAARTARLSFYSAHTCGASANCYFTATVFSNYSDDRNAEIAVWTAAAIIPLATAYFRIDSGHHFATDALVGYTMGALVGSLIPVFHRRDDDPAASGATATMSRSSSSTALAGFALGTAIGLLPALHHRLSLEPARVDGAPGVVATIKF